MSVSNSIISLHKIPVTPPKVPKELHLSEKLESLLEIPSHLLQRAIQICESKTELVVYMTILRYSLGFSRDRCTVSRRFIATWTGLHYQNVGRGVEGLLAKGLIEKMPESNAKLGDVFKILHLSENAIVTKPALTRNQNDYTEAPKSNQTENTQGVIKVIMDSNQLDDGAASERLRSVINPITKNQIEDLKESSSISEGLEKYISSCSLPHVRKIERRCLNELLAKYKVSQIELALGYVQKHGTVGDQANCKLPLCYLAKSIARVLELVDAQRSTQERQQERVKILEFQRQTEIQKQKASEAEMARAADALNKAYPDSADQDRILGAIERERYPLLQPGGKTARSLALRYWFLNIHQKFA